MLYNYNIPNSSLISRLEYNDETENLTIYFKTYFIEEATYAHVSWEVFEQLFSSTSLGKFYLSNIKNKYLQIKKPSMADKQKPRGINKASDKKRFIQLSINVKYIVKEWLVVGEKGGVYLNCTLQMLPDGNVDRLENLGMITQPVPKEIYEAEKNLPKEEKTNGPILGNGKELYFGEGGPEATKEMSQLTEEEQQGVLDDLPF